MKPLPVDHAEREAAANHLDTTFFVEAAAGTGKNALLSTSAIRQAGCGQHSISGCGKST